MSREEIHFTDLSTAGGKPDDVRRFLFGGAEIQREKEGVRAVLHMDLRTEGWVGIPHGGIGMGAIVDLAMLLDGYPRDKAALYPLSAEFRLGGAGVRTGESVLVCVFPQDGGAGGIISAGKDAPPYMTASLAFAKDEPERRNLFASYLPGRFADIAGGLVDMPSYRNCFVCGVARRHPGLRRRFHLYESDRSGKIVIARAGFDPEDGKSFYLFQRDGFVHPLALIALLDEVVGWGGFLLAGSGGVTVRIGYTFYRPVGVGEKIIAFGRGEKVKGQAGARLLFWASGGAAAVKDDGSLEPVAAASAQYFGVPELTEQMKAHLIPEDLAARVFAIAGFD
jgi:hypothetical protein